MHSLRSCALWACIVTTALQAQTTTTGTIAVGGGTASVDGDKPAFQQTTQHNQDGFGGIEEFTILNEGKDMLWKFDGRLLPGDDDYRIRGRLDYREKFYVDAGYEQYRVWYDGSGGVFIPRNLSFTLFDEDLSLIRSTLWTEVGANLESGLYLKLRYERRTRDGTKGSTMWGDTTMIGSAPGTYRDIVPSFYDLDEVTNTVTFDIGNESKEEAKWNAGLRYSENTLDNKRYTHRRPGEANAQRIVTSKDTTSTDIFAAHGYYLRQIGEKLTISGGALITDLDSNISGSRIYGQSYDPVYDPGYARRQQRDEGFYNLDGDGNLKQTILNLNAVYVPTKNWSVRPSLRFENLHQETAAEFVETNVGGSPGFVSTQDELTSESDKKLDEFAEAVEVRYTGKPNWVFSGEMEFIQGSGDVTEEEREVVSGEIGIDRDTEIERKSQKYSLAAKWYPRPGLSLAGEYYHKIKDNSYNAVRDSTPSITAGDRYPAFITEQIFETDDVNIRVSWRPMPGLNTVTRYDYQLSTINSTEAGLPSAESSTYTSHIISENITWSPTGRLYLTCNVNVTYDQIATPPYAFLKNGDNNYVNGSLGGGYALAKLDDLYFDYSWYHADNFIDNSASSMPYGVSQKQQAASITWVRRQSAHLVYTVKYGYITNRDETSPGLNDFDAHTIYAKVQYHF